MRINLSAEKDDKGSKNPKKKVGSIDLEENAFSSVLRNLTIWTVRMSHTMAMFYKWKSNPAGYNSHGTWLLSGGEREQSIAIW